MNLTTRAVLPSDSLDTLQSFSFPAYRGYVKDAIAGNEKVIALLAEDAGVLVGMLVATVYPTETSRLESTLASVFVPTAYRRLGVATELMRCYLQQACQRGVALASVVYTDGKPDTQAVERLLARAGWKEPQPRMVVIKQHWRDVLVAPHAWCRDLPPPANIAVVPWSAVTPEQRDSIRRWQNESREIPYYLFPDEVEGNADLHLGSSVGLEIDGQILGWVLTHPLENRVLRFTASYVKRSLQRRAYLIYLLRAATSQMEPHGFDFAIFTVPAQDHRMFQFAIRRIAPHSEYCRYSKIATFEFGQAATYELPQKESHRGSVNE
jgi:GNAT superfamily N-acetyltransferase